MNLIDKPNTKTTITDKIISQTSEYCEELESSLRGVHLLGLSFIGA